MQNKSHLVDLQTQVTVQQSTLTSVTLERDELTEEKAALEHKCAAAQSQINNLEVSTVKGTSSRQIQWLDASLQHAIHCMNDTLQEGLYNHTELN